MAGQRRQSASKTPANAATPSTVSTPVVRPNPPAPTSKLKIHPLLETYEATISALIGSLSEDPYKPESTAAITQRLVQCEKELEEALEEGILLSTFLTAVKLHYENTMKIQQLQKENAELSRLFSTNLTSLSEARTLLASLPDSRPATIDSITVEFKAD